MEAEVAALIGAGATALVELMLNDAWSQAKRIALRALGRDGDGDRDQHAEDELEQARQEVAEARRASDNEREAELIAEWTSRLRRAAERDDEAVAHIRDLIELHQTTEPGSTQQPINVSAIARDSSRVYQQGSGTQNNY